MTGTNHKTSNNKRADPVQILSDPGVEGNPEGRHGWRTRLCLNMAVMAALC